MSEGLLDIGTLTGAIELDDHLTSSLELVQHKVESFAEEFLGEFKYIAGATAAVGAAIIGIAGTITGLAVKGSEVNDVAESFDHLSGSVSKADANLEAMQKGTVGVINNLELMKDANQLLSAGVKATAEDFETLTTAAHVLANQGFGPLPSILDQLDRAMITGSTYRVKRLGITIDLKQAEIDYAQTLGVASSQLTQEQSLEARRVALMAEYAKVVESAGPLTLSMAEKYEAATTAVSNWVHELERQIATSPAVNAAWDAIARAIHDAFGGDSQAILERIVGWVNNFAEAVKTYAPPVIHFFGDIADWLGKIYTTVTGYWDALPDWLKTVVKDAAIATAGIYLTEKALDAVMGKIADAKSQAGITDILGTASSWGTITSAMIDSSKVLGGPMKSALVGAAEGMATLVTHTQALGLRYGLLNTGTAMFRSGIANIGTGLTTATGGVVAFNASLTGTALVFGTVTVAAAAAAAVITIAYQGWRLWQENKDRAAAQSRQDTIDAENLKRANDVLGSSYTKMSDAIGPLNEYLKKKHEAQAQATEADKAAAAIAELYRKGVQAQVDAFVAVSTHIDTTAEAFSKLTTAQKLNRGVQDEVIKAMEAQMAAHIQLTDDEKKYYEAVTNSRLGDTQAAIARADNSKAVKDQADGLRSLGLTEEEVAQKMHLTVDQLRMSEKPILDRIASYKALGLSEAAVAERVGLTVEQMNRLVEVTNRAQAATDKLTEETDAYNLSLSHGSFDAWKKGEDDKMNREIRDLRQSVDWTQQAEDDIVTAHKHTADIKNMTDLESLGGTRANAKEELDTETNKLNLMLRNQQDVGKAQLQDQQEKVRELQRSYDHWQAGLSESEQKAAESVAVETAKRVSWYDAEIKKFAEMDAARRAFSASVEVTSKNLASAVSSLRFGATNTSGQAFVGGALNLAKEGFSFAEIVSILNGGPKGKPQGPRIPGFQVGVRGWGGGWAMVGERGPEILKLPAGSSVIPLPQEAVPSPTTSSMPMTTSVGASKSVNTQVNHFHVYGTDESSVRRMGNILMQQLKQGRMLPTA